MANYEIMMIIDPKKDIKEIEQFTNEIFKDGVKKFTKMDRTNLAYPINKSNTAQYVLVNVETEGDFIKEFTRKVNINKSIWRQLVINLDSERAVDSLKNMKKFEEFKARRAAERAEREKNGTARPFRYNNRDQRDQRDQREKR
ncbi:MAG: 30S ribosomal protein S6 [Mycoplasmatales bacterium]|nr:30S ribosomal protein S6 [Mycoplasmatales bacterium]